MMMLLFFSAKALQTIINLLSEQDLHYYWSITNGYYSTKVNNKDWSVEKAKTVLQAWQRKFVKVSIYNLHSDSTLQICWSKNTINLCLTNIYCLFQRYCYSILTNEKQL